MAFSFIVLLVGILLIFLEFYTPGGVLAVAGIICVLTSIASFFMDSDSILASIAFLVFAIGAISFIIWFALRRIKRTSDKNTFYLSMDQEGYQANSFDKDLIGKHGVSITDMGPSGFILIDNIRYQALCRGPYLNKGSEVVVIGGEGSHLIVKSLN